MQTGFYSNTGGMVAQFNRLDTVSNNLANINTNGYKRDDLVIGDYLRLYKENRDILPIDNHTRDASKFLNRSMVRVPHVVEAYTDYQAGALEHTGNALDLASKRANLFFVVQTPSGIAYTRDGSFTLNENSQLTTKDGHLVMSETNTPISINANTKITVANDGTIYAKNKDNLQDVGAIGKIKLVGFNNPKYLKKLGDNFYQTNEPEVLATGDRLVYQGYLEKSNVNGVSEMTSLIEVNRLVGMYQKVMDTQMNELNSDAINKLGTIRV